MRKNARIYLDNAATSWPKPTLVGRVVDDYLRRLGVSAGRGGYTEAEEVRQAVEKSRTAVARLVGAESDDRIAFTLNGTDSLNLAIHGILKPGDHVVTTVCEHNSVLRPLRYLEKRGELAVTRVKCDQFGLVSAEDVGDAILPTTKLIVVSHASNVTGALQPVVNIGEIAQQRGILYLVDAAQTMGHLPVSVNAIGADLLAAPGHKGLLGPLGTGLLYIRSGVEELIDCGRQGGTGSSSSSDEQPEGLPEKYESGSHNVPGIIGLGAGIEYLEQRGLNDIRQHSIELTDQLLAGLAGIPGVTVYGPRESVRRMGVVSVTFAGQDAPTVAKRLEEEFRVQVRGGFQCAALMHRSLGTVERKGAVRFSVGPFNTGDEIETAIEAAKTVAGSRHTAAEPVDCPCVSSFELHGQASLHSTAPTVAASGSDELKPSQPATRIEDIPGLDELWSQTLGDPSVCVAILDGPVDLTHECFRGADLDVHPSYRYAIPNGGAATQHGTHVASIIFGTHGSSVSGVAPGSHGVSIPVFRDGPDGGILACSQVELTRAITTAVDYAKQRGSEALIINISGGQLTPSGEAHPLLKDVVSALDREHHLVVAAAGNQGCDCLHVPGAIPSVLAVGAMNAAGLPMPFSNWGEAYQQQGVLAPGEHISGASVGQVAECRTGTSYATPIVSGVVSLLLSQQLARRESPSTSRVRSAILRSAVHCDQEPINDCERLLAGRLSVTRATSMLQNEELNMSDAPSESHTLPAVTPQDDSSPEARIASADTCHTPASAQGTGPTAATPPNAPGASGVHRDKLQETLVMPAGCGCESGDGATMQKAYAIGSLGIDFGTESRRDSIATQLDDSQSILDYLEQNKDESTDVIWTLSQDATPIYAVQPVGAFAHETYEKLLEFLKAQTAGDIQRVAVPGIVGAGSVTLLSGQSVSLLATAKRANRGLAAWNTDALLKQFKLGDKDDDQALKDFLNKVYYETRNLGLTSKERALNYAVTNVFDVVQVFNRASEDNLQLDYVDVENSSVCRPGSDCQDVRISFYDPDNVNRANLVFRFTIDVSDVIPVAVDQPRVFRERVR